MRRVVAVAVALATLLAGAPAWAADSAGAPATIAEREAELEAIRGEIARLQASVETAKQRAHGLEGELERIGLELELQERRLAEAATAKALADQRVAESERAIAELEQRLVIERERLEERLTGLYRLGRHGSIRMLLALEPGEHLLPAVRWLRYLVRRDADLVARFEDLKARLAVEREELGALKSTADSWFVQQQRRRDELARLEANRERLLERARREGERLADRALELGDRARKLSAFVDFLYGRNPDALAGLPIQDFRGVLDWPVRGRVVTGFGPRLDPRYKTRVPHNGVDIAAAPGATVVVVYPGKVVFAAPFEGYGPTVVVQHAGRAFTLYAGLAEVSVARDDMLSLQQAVGVAASGLYFEIRIGNRPQDPLSWMRSSDQNGKTPR